MPLGDICVFWLIDLPLGKISGKPGVLDASTI
jgi:hypothetical protein